MTARLEERYRRLLAVYPAAHRRAYEAEMVGVLMDGARPGQQRPTAAEFADLLWSGLAARLGHPGRSRSHEAAGVVAYLGVLLVTADALRGLIGTLMFMARTHAVVPLFDLTARSLAWSAVLVTVLVGARRAAVLLAGAGLLVDGGVLAFLPAPRVPMWFALSLVTTVLLALARGARPAGAVLGRLGTSLAAASVLVGTTGASLTRWLGNVHVPGVGSLPDAIVLTGILLAVVAAGHQVRRQFTASTAQGTSEEAA